jgi:hypothetical protein
VTSDLLARADDAITESDARLAASKLRAKLPVEIKFSRPVQRPKKHIVRMRVIPRL